MEKMKNQIKLIQIELEDYKKAFFCVVGKCQNLKKELNQKEKLIS